MTRVRFTIIPRAGSAGLDVGRRRRRARRDDATGSPMPTMSNPLPNPAADLPQDDAPHVLVGTSLGAMVAF